MSIGKAKICLLIFLLQLVIGLFFFYDKFFYSEEEERELTRRTPNIQIIYPSPPPLRNVSFDQISQRIIVITDTRNKDQHQLERFLARSLDNNISAHQIPQVYYNSTTDTEFASSPLLSNKNSINKFLSHVSVWKYAKQQDYNSVIIFEQNAIFHKNFNDFFKEQWRYLPQGDISGIQFFHNTNLRTPEDTGLNSRIWFTQGFNPGLTAYRITKSTILFLLNNLNYNRTLDSGTIRTYCSTFADHCWIPVTPLVIPDVSGEDFGTLQDAAYHFNWDLSNYEV